VTITDIDTSSPVAASRGKRRAITKTLVGAMMDPASPSTIVEASTPRSTIGPLPGAHANLHAPPPLAPKMVILVTLRRTKETKQLLGCI
jgi:hypothetical protein